MPNIQNVNYTEMPKYAKDMRAKGQALNKDIKQAYQEINNLRNYWYGQRYNSLIKDFNNIIPNLNELLTLVVGDIPYALETVANNYSQADQGKNATSAQKTSPDKISNISNSTQTGMKFITNQVSSTKTKVSQKFEDAKDKMNQIETTFNRINWQSEAATAFKSKFKSLKNQITQSFKQIETEFAKSMQQTLDDMSKTEKANTVS